VELRFSEHAAERMRERAIDAAEVAEILSHPEDRHPSADEPTQTVVIGRTPAGRQLFLVVIGSDPVLVVTVAERHQPPRRYPGAVLVTYDPEGNATYVKLSDATVATTEQFGDSLAVDLDNTGEPVGVELLIAPATATSATLAPLVRSYPSLSVIEDLLHRLTLAANAR
jgi:uncharacterized protein YuzE